MYKTLVKYGKYAIPFFVAGKIVSCVALIEIGSNIQTSSKLEQIAKNHSVITDKDTSDQYIVDFNSKELKPYDKNLRDIIEGKIIEEKNDYQN